MGICQWKQAVPFILFLFLFTCASVSVVHAEEKSIIDCLDNEENCFDEEDSPSSSEQEDNEIPQVLEEKKSGSLFITIIKMIFALLFILVLLYGLLLFLKRKNKLFQQTTILGSIGGISVGPNKSIQIIQLAGSMYMVGVGDNVELLEEITDEAVKQELLEKHEKKIDAPSFLQQYFSKKKTKQQEDSPSFLSTLQREMINVKQNRKQMINHHSKKEGKDV